MEIEEAIGLITANAQPIKDVLTVSLDEAYGHVLAEDLTASVNVPAFPRSAMDGYAVRSGDITDATTDRPVRLKVTGKVIAGQCADIKCEAGTAVRIMTGAMIPDGYDAVVMQEDTDLGQDLVSIYKSVGRYVNYCHEGEEIKKGDTVLTSGTLIGMIETGLIASLGKDRVSVRRPIKVSIISTGSELTCPGNSLPKGCIYGNIRYMLASAIKGAGFEVTYSDDCPDDREIIIDRVSQTTESDVIITTDPDFYAKVYNDSNWASINAVKNHEVYLSPQSPFKWFDRPVGANMIIGVPWTAKVIYPDQYSDIDMLSATKEFYSNFYHFDLSDDQAKQILLDSGLKEDKF